MHARYFDLLTPGKELQQWGMRSVELFTGAGGLAMGFSMAGFSHALVLERDPDSCQTIRLNQRLGIQPVVKWPLVETDVCTFDYSSISGLVDLVAGGPPCQPFSLGGKHRGHTDSRDMFPEAVRAVRELRPRAFVFENVKGLRRQNFADYFNFILLQLEFPEVTRRKGETWEDHNRRLQRTKTEGRCDGLRYNIVVDLLNAADFGVPQRRERVFFVGFRSDVGEKWSFPEKTHARDALLRTQWVTGEYWDEHRIPKNRRPEKPSFLNAAIERVREVHLPRWRTVRDVISDLPDPVANKRNAAFNHIQIPGARTYPGHTGSPLDEPAKTIKAGDHGVPGGENMLALPDGSVRYFTVRESARLQTFPDEYLFAGSWTESMRQIGNAVPVTLAKVVADSVRRALNRPSMN